MNITLAQAYEAAQKQLGERFTITKAYKGQSSWFFSYGILDMFGQGDGLVYPIPGGANTLAVSMASGDVRIPDFFSITLPPGYDEDGRTPDELEFLAADTVELPSI